MLRLCAKIEINMVHLRVNLCANPILEVLLCTDVDLFTGSLIEGAKLRFTRAIL